MRFESKQILNIGSLATTTSLPMDITHEWMWSIQFTWTGTATGTITINVSNDNGVTWSPFTAFDQSLAQPAGSAGSMIAIPKSNAGYQMVQAVYTHASGTGTLTAQFFAKGV